MEYDVQHPVPVSSMLMFGDIHLRAGTGHYYVNAGLTERFQIMQFDHHGYLGHYFSGAGLIRMLFEHCSF